MIDKSSKEGKDLARVQIKSMKTSDRGLANGLSDIREYGFSMSLSSSMIEKAQEIFGEAIKLPEFKSNERTLFISSALFFACRHAGVDRSINEICRFTKADEHKVGKMNSRLRLCDSILPLIKRPKGSALAATKSSQFINRFCSHLKLDARFASYAFGIATRLEEATLLEGRNPSTLAAACILIAVNEKKRSDEKYSRSAADIARVAGVSEASVKKAYKDLMPSMHLLI
jgi:transcription initiation factor TFIIB